MGPWRAQELGASQNLCCPGRMPGHLAGGYPSDASGQASARAVVDSTAFVGGGDPAPWACDQLLPTLTGTSALPWAMGYRAVADVGVSR